MTVHHVVLYEASTPSIGVVMEGGDSAYPLSCTNLMPESTTLVTLTALTCSCCPSVLLVREDEGFLCAKLREDCLVAIIIRPLQCLP